MIYQPAPEQAVGNTEQLAMVIALAQEIEILSTERRIWVCGRYGGPMRFYAFRWYRSHDRAGEVLPLVTEGRNWMGYAWDYTDTLFTGGFYDAVQPA